MVNTQTDQIFEDIVETIHEPLLVLDSDLKVILSNHSFYEFFKVTPEVTVGQFIYDLGNKQWEIPKLRVLLENILSQNTTFNAYEIEHDFATIGRRTMLLNARQIEQAMGKERIILLAIEDITERKRLDAALEESEERFRRLFETANDGILLLEKHEFKIRMANPAITKMLGYSNEEFFGKNLKDVGFQDDIGTVKEALHTLDMNGIILRDNSSLKKKSGQFIDTDIYMVDKTNLIQCNIRDITERKKFEEDILRGQKLESIGLLAAGIAHDFNNIMTTILGTVSIAKMQARPEDEIFDLLSESERAIARAQALTKQLLTFAKGGAPVKVLASIKDILKESSSFVLRGSKSGCEFSIAEDLWPAEADVGQISQVINNVVINANQAMPKGGIIQVAAVNLIIDDGYGLPLKQGRYIKISIIDQGVGIPQKHLLNIFDPYFTTKQEGSGLGLATTYSIIKKHDGHITVESQLEVGTTFHIYLPASDKAVLEKEVARLIKGQGRILCMDDESSIRKMVGMMLELLGYESEFAKDGAEAIQKCKAAKEAQKPFDAAILDLTIPGGMGGKEVINILLEINPELKAIVSSGYSDDPVMSNFHEYGFKGMMPKPYTSISLSKVLHEVLKG